MRVNFMCDTRDILEHEISHANGILKTAYNDLRKYSLVLLLNCFAITLSLFCSLIWLKAILYVVYAFVDVLLIHRIHSIVDDIRWWDEHYFKILSLSEREALTMCTSNPLARDLIVSGANVCNLRAKKEGEGYRISDKDNICVRWVKPEGLHLDGDEIFIYADKVVFNQSIK